jgi:HlyD family secretion protein
MATISMPNPAKAAPGHDVRKPGRPKLIVGALLVLLPIAVAAYFYNHRVRSPEYLTVRIDRGDIDSTVTTTGTLNAVITVQVGSQVSGNILALYADFNTKVKKGQLVAQIDPAPFNAVVQQATATLNAAKAAVATAQAALAKSQSDLASAQSNTASQKANLVRTQSAVELARVENERRKTMVASGSTSQEDADTAQANYEQALAAVDAGKAAVDAAQAAAESAGKAVEVARSQLDQARAVVSEDEASLAQAQLNLDHTRILAPVDGTVESRNMDVGQTVAASFQAPVIFLIAQDLTQMQVDTNVDEADVGPIRVDQQATFTVDAWPGRTFQGHVAQIREAPINVQNVVTYDVVIDVSNQDLKLFPGMTANATIFTGHAAHALRIPKAALRFRTRPGTLWVVDSNGQPKALKIRTGISDANHVELLAGDLKEGDAVITGLVSRAPAGSGAAGSGAAGSSGNNSSGKRLGI